MAASKYHKNIKDSWFKAIILALSAALVLLFSWQGFGAQKSSHITELARQKAGLSAQLKELQSISKQAALPENNRHENDAEFLKLKGFLPESANLPTVLAELDFLLKPYQNQLVSFSAEDLSSGEELFSLHCRLQATGGRLLLQQLLADLEEFSGRPAFELISWRNEESTSVLQAEFKLYFKQD